MRFTVIFIFGLLLFSCKKEQAKQAVAPEVPVMPVIQKDVSLIKEYVGQTFGGADVGIRARVPGYLTAIHFREGAEVKKGQLLYTVDPLPTQTRVDQAKGELASAEAMLVKAKSDLDRIKPLAEMNAVSQKELVSAEGQYNAAIGQKQAAEAAVQNARIELGYASITSPIDGVIGSSVADVGDYVGSLGSLTLNTVSNIETIRVRFAVTELEYLEFRKRIIAGEKLNTEVQLILTDGSILPQAGKIDWANRAVDPATGTLSIEATFPNADKLLRPGQFVRIRYAAQTLHNALLVPQRAVTELQGTYSVYVVDKDNKIQIRSVSVGERSDDLWIIAKGLEPSDKVALLGNQAIQVNSIVTPVVMKADSTKI